MLQKETKPVRKTRAQWTSNRGAQSRIDRACTSHVARIQYYYCCVGVDSETGRTADAHSQNAADAPAGQTEQNTMAAQAQRQESTPAAYAFGRVLGEGAFAHCVLAKDKTTCQSVAVKIMLKSHVEREGKVRAVHAEREALSRCKSAHVVRLIETFQDRDYLFFVLEYCPGGDLRRLLDADIVSIRGDKGLAPYAAAFYAADVLLGLQHLHSLSIAHRDIKPENVFLDVRGRCKLGDFGAVLDLRGGARVGSFDGTAEYVSPEVLEGEATSVKCDLWALGCLIFQLWAGRLPFTGATDFLIWESVISFAEGDKDAVDFSDVSEEIECVVRALLKRDPEERLSGQALEAHAFFATNCSVNDVRAGTACAPWTPAPATHDCAAVFTLDYMLGLEAGSYGDHLPTERVSECSTSTQRKLVGSHSARRALDDVDWDSTLTGERVVAKGLLWKRKGLFWRERVFLLTSAPRLVYYDASKPVPERKGAVEWPTDASPKIRRRSPARFDVCVAGRDYHLAAKGDGDDSADAWIARLSRVFSGEVSPQAGRQGWIHKRGGGATSSAYRRRYAILRGNQLFYYRRPPAAQAVAPQGVVRVVSARIAPNDAKLPGKAAFTMEADSGRTFHVCVDTAAERRAWLEVLPAAAPCA